MAICSSLILLALHPAVQVCEDCQKLTLLFPTVLIRKPNSFIFKLVYALQNKLFEEILSILGPEGPVDVENLKVLEYTEMVVLEALRLLPVLSIFGRQNPFDVHLSKNPDLYLHNIQSVFRSYSNKF